MRYLKEGLIETCFSGHGSTASQETGIGLRWSEPWKGCHYLVKLSGRLRKHSFANLRILGFTINCTVGAAQLAML